MSHLPLQPPQLQCNGRCQSAAASSPGICRNDSSAHNSSAVSSIEATSARGHSWAQPVRTPGEPLHVGQAVVSVAIHLEYCTSIQYAMEHDFGLSCSCGSENFERVVVRRLGQRDYCTEFVACVLCKVMFHVPEAPHQSDPTLELDAAIAARLYKKPGRRR